MVALIGASEDPNHRSENKKQRLTRQNHRYKDRKQRSSDQKNTQILLPYPLYCWLESANCLDK